MKRRTYHHGSTKSLCNCTWRRAKCLHSLHFAVCCPSIAKNCSVCEEARSSTLTHILIGEEWTRKEAQNRFSATKFHKSHPYSCRLKLEQRMQRSTVVSAARLLSRNGAIASVRTAPSAFAPMQVRSPPLHAKNIVLTAFDPEQNSADVEIQEQFFAIQLIADTKFNENDNSLPSPFNNCTSKATLRSFELLLQSLAATLLLEISHEHFGTFFNSHAISTKCTLIHLNNGCS